MLILRTLTPIAAAAAAMGVLVSTAAAQPASAPPTATLGDPSAPVGSPANPIKQSSPTPPGDAYRLKAGDPTVISNAPVPDTPENRARYGAPMSHGGAHTSANGD